MARRDQRRQAFYDDQHGRTYSTQVDTKTGDPAEGLTPIGWTAPRSPGWARGLLRPPAEVLVVQQSLRGNVVEVDYDRWLGMLEGAEQAYQQRAQQVASNLSANYLDLLQNPTAAFLSAMGPRPFPGLDVVQAMKDGDDWALGFSDEVPAWMTPGRLNELKQGALAAGLLSAEQQRAMREEERRTRLASYAPAQAARYEDAPGVERVKTKKAAGAA